jgi:hypothetical protein
MGKKQVKALVLLSGGLDSILAVKLLLEQGILVETVVFCTNFSGPKLARVAAKTLGVPLREVDIKKEFIEVLKKPKHGYGAGLNPCIDCHALMLKKAGEIMRSEDFDFVATGEVLGERPMSQHKPALDIVEKDAKLKGYLLRPLSAKLLEETIAEKEGLVDREKLMDISGRVRKIQMALAQKYGIKEYPTPAGGCALTQDGFAARMKELMKNKPDFTPEDIDLVAIGRHFFYPELVEGGGNVQIILGRNEEENEILKSQKKPEDVFILPINFSGPEALIRGGKIRNEIIEQAKELIVKFSPKASKLKTEERIFDILKE